MATSLVIKLLLVCAADRMNVIVATSDDCDLDPTQKTWCVVSDYATPKDVGIAMESICASGLVPCDACPGSNDWAFNAYFQQKWKQDGAQGCDFDGAGQLVWPSSSPCRPSASSEQWCFPKPKTPLVSLQGSLDFLCGEGGVDCTLVEEGKGCVFPADMELLYKAEYAYNEYYQKTKNCDFQGTGELMNSDCSPSNDQKTWCSVKEGAPSSKVVAALNWMGRTGALREIYDRCPGQSRQKDSWMYNEVFKQNYKVAGNKACDYSGTGQISWPAKSPCRPSEKDSQLINNVIEKKWCLPKENVSSTEILAAINFICNVENCSLIGDGGDCVFPANTDVQNKAEWAFNLYYQKHYRTGGRGACDFGGIAQLSEIAEGLPPARPVEPEGSICTLDTSNATWCVASPWAPADAVEKAINFICTGKDATVDCDLCPDSTDWKFNAYFQKNFEQLGAYACELFGAGQLTWSPTSPCRPSQDDEEWCLPEADTWPANKDALEKEFVDICNDSLDCDLLTKQSICVFPLGMEVIYKAEWAYNKLFKQTKECGIDGEGAFLMDSGCDLDDDQDTQCVVSDTASASRVFSSVAWVCGNEFNKVVCDRCPVQGRVKETWIYNEFFRKNYKEAGSKACNFKGTGQLAWPAESPCRPMVNLASPYTNWCVAKPGANASALVDAIGYACGQEGVDCSLIAETGDCQFPMNEEVKYKADWAFNAFFQHNSEYAGNKACDFGGLATITWPKDTICLPDKSADKWCLAKKDVSSETLVKDIEYVCSTMDCSTINEVGKCLYPIDQEVRLKASWVFNTYYQKFKTDGACDFSGHAHLVDPNMISENGASTDSKTPLFVVV